MEFYWTTYFFEFVTIYALNNGKDWNEFFSSFTIRYS